MLGAGLAVDDDRVEQTPVGSVTVDRDVAGVLGQKRATASLARGGSVSKRFRLFTHETKAARIRVELPLDFLTLSVAGREQQIPPLAFEVESPVRVAQFLSASLKHLEALACGLRGRARGRPFLGRIDRVAGQVQLRVRGDL